MSRWKHYLVWTEEAVARLRELWAGELSASQIAPLFGISRNAVIGKAHRLRLPRRKPGGQFKDGKGPAKRRSKPPRLIRAGGNLPPVLVARAEPPPPIEAAILPPTPKTLWQLRPHHCHYPLWGDEHHPAHPLYCGGPIARHPWCAAHAEVVFSAGLFRAA